MHVWGVMTLEEIAKVLDLSPTRGLAISLRLSKLRETMNAASEEMMAAGSR